MTERLRESPRGDHDIDGLVRQCVDALRPLGSEVSVEPEQILIVRRDIDGAEAEVAIVLTRDAIEVRLPAGIWPLPYRLIMLHRPWKSIDLEDVAAGDDLGKMIRSLVEEGLNERALEFFTCHYCGGKTAPEHGDGEACHGCRSEHEGVVY